MDFLDLGKVFPKKKGGGGEGGEGLKDWALHFICAVSAFQKWALKSQQIVNSLGVETWLWWKLAGAIPREGCVWMVVEEEYGAPGNGSWLCATLHSPLFLELLLWRSNYTVPGDSADSSAITPTVIALDFGLFGVQNLHTNTRLYRSYPQVLASAQETQYVLMWQFLNCELRFRLICVFQNIYSFDSPCLLFFFNSLLCEVWCLTSVIDYPSKMFIRILKWNYLTGLEYEWNLQEEDPGEKWI